MIYPILPFFFFFLTIFHDKGLIFQSKPEFHMLDIDALINTWNTHFEVKCVG